MASPTLTGPPPTAATSTRTRAAVVALVGIVLVALNLRMAITGLGALLDEVRAGLGLSGTMAGLVTTLPTLAFAGFGALTPALARRYPPARVLVIAMAALAAGQLLRAWTGAPAVFVAATALALAGIAVANVLLPAVVKQYFPARTGLVTGLYTMALVTGTTVAAAGSVPIAHAFGSWRAGLGAWALLAVIATLPWLRQAVARRGAAHREGSRVAARVHAHRTRLGWGLAVYFGTQSLSGYATMGWLAQLFRDNGYTPEVAGLLLAGVTAVAVPITLLMPTYAGRRPDLRGLVVVLSAAMFASYFGLMIAPHGGAVLWVVLLAIGQAAFPLALVMIGMRARTAGGVVALSAFAQSAGYLLASLGPLLVGLLYEATGGWLAPLWVLVAAAAVQTVSGLAVARPRYVEDEQDGRER
ncbi:CynX/NimT family MFS transporter [Rhizomonospora bruguierae]|uniref:CynX/NimT family MFS transporter n=1 Tax=Rhizomonospora bruguierae TaxID=1581705 RepID=UPI001BD0393B|nr:MFS transporter [Micromonospora sp. NBRC 107566]